MSAHSSSQGTPRALIVGAGIAGLAAATSLHRAGWEAVIIERAAGRRRGGYFVALTGAGRYAAERLGSLDLMPDRASQTRNAFDIDREGNFSPSISLADQVGAPRMMLRGDIENALFERLPSEVEIRFSSQPTEIVDHGSHVEVTIVNAETGTSSTERFDLLIGADGLRSTVRRMAFGPDEDFLAPLGYVIAATVLDGGLRGISPQDGVSLVESGRGAFAFGLEDGRQTLFLNYRPDDMKAEFSRSAIESLRAAFGPEPAGEVLGDMLDQFENSDEFLFDSASQVKMPQWVKGRVIVLGDSAWCPTLYAGLGASSALAGADLLGKMLELHPEDLAEALADWERTMRPHVDKFQECCFILRPFFIVNTPEELRQRQEAVAKLSDAKLREEFYATEEQKKYAEWKNVDVVPIVSEMLSV
ncbi:FAD-dependent monooxygenase [Psychromicrobium sp. YIM B11713]|uniref:FAD-dependent monooxygenase n=1 Tax=Psychromicrobium sp. YIM B11713 TaxID=3145233 RepID=UPI00374F3AE6